MSGDSVLGPQKTQEDTELPRPASGDEDVQPELNLDVLAAEEVEDEESRGKKKKKKLSLKPKATWTKERLKVDFIINHSRAELAMGLIVMFNAVLMVFETDGNAACGDGIQQACDTSVVDFLNRMLLGIYSVELGARMYVERERFPYSNWNILDFTIVFSGYLDLILVSLLNGGHPALSMVRMLRMARIMRIAKIFKPLPELFALITGFASTMRAILCGFVMIMVLLAIWGLVAVEFIYPRSKEIMIPGSDNYDDWCAAAFSSTPRAILYFFQTLVAGDSWGACGVGLVLHSPGTFLVFACALLTVQVGFVNLILSVIVDAAAKAREADAESMMEEKKKQEQEDLQQFYEIMARIDEDESGTLSLQELLDGLDHDAELEQRFNALEIRRTDLDEIFSLMDLENSGELEYSHFVEHIENARNQDMRMQILILNLELKKIRHILTKDVVPAIRDTHTAKATSNGTKPRPPDQLPEIVVKALDAKGTDVVSAALSSLMQEQLEHVSASIEQSLKFLIAETAQQVASLQQHNAKLEIALAGEVLDIDSPNPNAGHHPGSKKLIEGGASRANFTPSTSPRSSPKGGRPPGLAGGVESLLGTKGGAGLLDVRAKPGGQLPLGR